MLPEQPADSSAINHYLSLLPDLTPRSILKLLRQQGYIGQEKAAKAVCLMAYRHINRLKYIFLDHIAPEELPTKDNHLLIGPTGCGKTFLVELVFGRILQLPYTIIDITAYSETGYIGQDAVSMLTRLVHAANGDYELASIGVICIDEFDKLATSKNSAVFSGQGTTKDVSGFGVQKELLKMLEGAEIAVPIELSHSSYSPRETMRTHNITFIACGAFSGIDRVISQGKYSIGFGASASEHAGKQIAYELDDAEISKAFHFQNYGMMPELIGRFSRIIPFHPLSRKDLANILKKNVIAQYEKELELAGCKLNIQKPVLDKIVDDAFDRETGARGIKNALLGYIEDACFELYSRKKKSKVLELFLENGEVGWRIR